MSDFTFSTEDFILYLLNKIEPGKCDLYKLNKVAFFTEFAFVFRNGKPLSEAQYAAIPKGPAIDQYKVTLDKMEREGKIKKDGYIVRPLVTQSVQVPPEISDQIDRIIEKYSRLTQDELISLSHLTDSYKITTDNERVTTGNIIDKKLAALETFFEDSPAHGDTEDTAENEKLIAFDRGQLKPYDV